MVCAVESEDVVEIVLKAGGEWMVLVARAPDRVTLKQENGWGILWCID